MTVRPTEYRHCRLLDHPRGDWADTIARRFFYELADEARLASIGPGYRPLADLVEKLRREERYHRMHVMAWLDRLANGGPEPRRRLEAALLAQGLDAPTVFTPLEGEAALLEAGILSRPLAGAEAAWRADLTSIMVPLGLALPPSIEPSPNGRRPALGGVRLAVERVHDGPPLRGGRDVVMPAVRGGPAADRSPRRSARGHGGPRGGARPGDPGRLDRRARDGRVDRR
jgi:hypothetical protein